MDIDSGLIEEGWRAQLGNALADTSFNRLKQLLSERKADGATIYPPEDQIFAAFNTTPFDGVRVIILGQDPYHGLGQAMGLSFSVPADVRVPPSLRNIFKEITSDIGTLSLTDGDLMPWARQGVFLLNTSLTVEDGKAGAHAKFGWANLTDKAVTALSDQREHLVFMLWGAHAQQKIELIDANTHLVLTAPHPSPLSARRGFFCCGHFSKANQYLEEHGYEPIAW
ncbi:MAG: uracil-DNA glycosylase [Pseudomonadota bacterium]